MSLPFRDCWNVAGERKEQRLGEYLPPSGITETLGIHLAHVSHTDNANRGILHGAAHSGKASDATILFRSCLRILVQK